MLMGTDRWDSYAETEVTNLTFDSRKVTPGTLFIAKGVHFKEEYLFSSLEKGAVAYISDRIIAGREKYIAVNDIRGAMALISSTAPAASPTGALPSTAANSVHATNGLCSTRVHVFSSAAMTKARMKIRKFMQ
jgi:UDP-N-acetylmuramoyl-L-alanyl-D-glutamate--2,6-diaminopimelate ligase